MTCLEAQSKIMDFIENKLPEEETREFIKHVRTCDNCYEELEIYYTLIAGMGEGPSAESANGDFRAGLNAHLNEKMSKLTKAKRIATSSILVALVAITIGLIMLYGGILNRVYDHEQNFKLSQQSTYYYSDTFGSQMYAVGGLLGEYMNLLETTSATEEETDVDATATFMAGVKSYNTTHKTYLEIYAEATEGDTDEENTLN